jgi:uncharacterized protein (TIGR03437 family)
MKTSIPYLKNRVCFPVLLALAFARASLADSGDWTVLGVQDTGIKSYNQLLAVLSPAGEIYSAGSGTNECPPPTLVFGSTQNAGCIVKTDASGSQVYSVQIGGILVEALVPDASGDVFIAGTSSPGSGLATTGAYESTPPGIPNPFVCELSSGDGHPLYCTYVDVVPTTDPNSNYFGTSGLAIDTAGDAYLAGDCASAPLGICVEKLAAGGTTLAFSTVLPTNLATPPSTPAAVYVAVDSQGNLFATQANAGIVKLNAAGAVSATIAVSGSQTPIALVLDPSGNPQVALQDTANPNNVDVRRYSADLSTTLFDTPLFLGTGSAPATAIFGMGIDSAGVAHLWGATSGANLPVVQPTATCLLPSPFDSTTAFLAGVGDDGEVLQTTYLGQPPNFVTISPIVFNSGGATLLEFGASTWQILQLGPAASEVALGCIGNAASFADMPLAPNEIVSLFGAGLGPAQLAPGQPDANGLYPFQLGGTEVTFDGIPAPLLYVSQGQVNLVTPQALQGKTTTHVCASQNQTALSCLDLPVQAAAPGVFASGYAGYTPYALILNQDGTLNSASNPAPAESVITLFATGLGALTPSPADGAVVSPPLPAQQLPIQVLFTWSTSDGSLPGSAKILYAGPAPGEIEGLAQISVQVPGPPANFFVFGGPSLQVEVTLPDGSQALSPYTALWTK